VIASGENHPLGNTIESKCEWEIGVSKAGDRLAAILQLLGKMGSK
jgi:hypothetical protein